MTLESLVSKLLVSDICKPTPMSLIPSTSSDIPLYGQVTQWLLQVIERDFEHEERFFTERELMVKLRVSQPTVRRAMQELVNKGVLRRHVGRGTFVQKFAPPRLVGIITPYWQSPVIMRQINALAQLCDAFDCNLRVHHTREGESVRDLARALKADANEERMVLLGHSQEDAWTLFDELDHRGFRVVCSAPFVSGYPGSSVSVDTEAGVRLALDHLVQHGHKRIAVIINEPVALGTIQIRLAALRKEALERGLDQCIFIECDAPVWSDSFNAAYEAMEEVMTIFPRPTAVVPVSGAGAWAALQFAGKHRLRVPEDFSLFAFDDLPGADWLYPALTGLGVDMAAAANHILEILWSEERQTQQLIVPPKLIVRESVGSPSLASRAGSKVTS